MKKLITHTILGYQFWIIFQAVAPMIWFYPLNELEISGYEAFAVVVFSPLLLRIACLENFFRCRYIRALIRVLSTLGIFSFHAPTTLQRLMALMAGAFFQMLSFALSLHYNEKEETVLGTSVGLLLFVASRVWLRSFVPAWGDKQSNVVVFTICIVATLDAIYDSFTSPAPSSSSQSSSTISSLSASSSTTSPSSSPLQQPATKQPQSQQEPPIITHWLTTSLMFGSLLYTTHAIFGEVSVLSRWTVQGYPDTGPMPFPWGALVFCCLCAGLYTSSCRHLVDSPVWWCLGGGSFLLLCCLSTWRAFAAGCFLAMFTTSVWPSVLTLASQHLPYKVLTFSMLVWLLQMLFSVWTVAYNFVPGGVYTRERTGSLVLAVVSSWLLYAFTKKSDDHPPASTYRRNFNKLILVVLLLGLAGFVYRAPSQAKGAAATARTSTTDTATTLTCAIWTFHFGYDNQGWPSLARAAAMLRTIDADVITLLESDASKPFLGNNDLAMWLSEELDMFVDFGELAPAISATIDVAGSLLDLVVTHMGNDRDVLDRKLQAETLTELLRDATNPAVFLGYVTSEPYSRDYRKLTTVAKDIDPSDHERWCQYIMYKNLTRLAYARISHGGLSDTEVQVGRFLMGAQHDNPFTTTDPARVPESVRFPSHFGPHRKGHYRPQRHKYHMDTPKYFLSNTK